jgi:hypothetical protein
VRRCARATSREAKPWFSAQAERPRRIAVEEAAVDQFMSVPALLVSS